MYGFINVSILVKQKYEDNENSMLPNSDFGQNWAILVRGAGVLQAGKVRQKTQIITSVCYQVLQKFYHDPSIRNWLKYTL